MDDIRKCYYSDNAKESDKGKKDEMTLDYSVPEALHNDIKKLGTVRIERLKRRVTTKETNKWRK
jgi:hypothetical protein